MAVYKAHPAGRSRRCTARYLTPTVSTIAMGAISIVVYVVMNYIVRRHRVIADAVIAIGLLHRLLLRADRLRLRLVLPRAT